MKRVKRNREEHSTMHHFRITRASVILQYPRRNLVCWCEELEA